MIIECCSQEKTFVRYYALLGSRFCMVRKEFQVRPTRTPGGGVSQSYRVYRPARESSDMALHLPHNLLPSMCDCTLTFVLMRTRQHSTTSETSNTPCSHPCHACHSPGHV